MCKTLCRILNFCFISCSLFELYVFFYRIGKRGITRFRKVKTVDGKVFFQIAVLVFQRRRRVDISIIVITGVAFEFSVDRVDVLVRSVLNNVFRKKISAIVYRENTLDDYLRSIGEVSYMRDYFHDIVDRKSVV